MINKSSILEIFIDFVTLYPRQFGLLFLLLVFEGLVAAASILTLVPLADFMLDSSLLKPSQITRFVIDLLFLINIEPNFWIFGGLFVLINLFKGSIEIFIRYAILRVKYSVTQGLIEDALITFFKSRMEFFNTAEQGQLLNSLNKELSTIGDTLGHLAALFAQIVQISIYIAVPLWLNSQLTMIALGLALLFGAPFMLLNNVSYRLGLQNTNTANIASGILTESLGSARLILGFGRQIQTIERYIIAFENHVKVSLRSQILSNAVPKLFQPMAMLAVVIAIGISMNQHANFSELAAVMWSLVATMPILSAMLQGNVSISNFLPSYEQLVMLRNRAALLEEKPGQKHFLRLHSDIQLNNVSFKYPGRAKTLEGISLRIVKSQMTALIGESGSGKSTVADLILGLQIPDIGQIYIDGVPLSEWQQNSFRQRVGYVPQEPQLFNSSIRNNLLWSFASATESELWSALQLANADSFVKELPLGIDTIVGDRGIRLSGGQRQRIALARALVRKPELLILDEATSALDSESEKLIQNSIEKLANATTIIVIAHRLSTIAKADQVYVLNQGKIVEEGSFAELSKKTGGMLFAMLVAQSEKI